MLPFFFPVNLRDFFLFVRFPGNHLTPEAEALINTPPVENLVIKMLELTILQRCMSEGGN